MVWRGRALRNLQESKKKIIISYLIKQGRLFDIQMRIANNKGIGTTKKQAKSITHDQETVLWQYLLNKEGF